MLTRAEVVAISRSWIGTKYVMGAGVKGAGVDCARYLAEVMIEAGFCERESLGLYSHDWFCNTTEDRYLFGLLRHARKTLEGICRGRPDNALPGCMALFKAVRSPLFNHGAIVTEWPMVIHAADPCVREIDATKHYMTSHTEMVVFDPWERPEC